VKEFRIFGPPGTGKTTRLATRSIPEAVKRYGPEGILVASFTRAAAKEIASRDIRLPENNVGTLHSLCYRSLGNPELTVRHIKDWNERTPLYALRNTGAGSLDEGGDEESASSNTVGDRLHSRSQIYRAKMIPPDKWPRLDVINFYKEWTAWKKESGLMDFTDLIENALRDRPKPPKDVKVMFLDEAQDFTPLQFALVRSWGFMTDWFVMVGDDDQCIYSFSGASPEAFLLPELEAKYKTVLEQSYRVPRAVHERALQVVGRLSTREEKEYMPRDAEGAVIDAGGDYKDPDEALERALEYAYKDDKTVMFLSQCSYMLEATKAGLKSRGVPFHNPYRRKNGGWNPLHFGGAGVSASEMLLSFLSDGAGGGHWKVGDFIKWASALAVGDAGLVRKEGNKRLKAIKRAVEAEEISENDSTLNLVPHILSPAAMEPALKRDVSWFRENLKKQKHKAIQYPLAVYENYGVDGLIKTPKITIGTVHSVKGGEADNVFLFPDVSFSCWKEMDSQEGQDAIHRVFYVGMTRTRENLHLMQPFIPSGGWKSPLFVEL
jgi:DNA helicase-2/ATP-dependent DNA helicase PcrA